MHVETERETVLYSKHFVTSQKCPYHVTFDLDLDPHISVGHRLYSKCNLIAETRFVIVNIYRKIAIRGHSKVMYFVVSGKTIRH